jgi:nucleoside-diphosphate-sugar epimerase
MKNVLMIGGSVFTGRVFSIRASESGEFNLHVVNRGNFPMELDRVTQYKCNRHSPRMIARLVPDIKYDALIDFCGYTPGEIKPMIEALNGRVSHYIFFSTARVYAEKKGFLNEDAPLSVDVSPMDDLVSRTIENKIQLERELIEACAKVGMKYTILRPSIIYGPYNHAPRESYYIGLIARKEPVPMPIDATARFSMVYVLDVADALRACIGDKRAHNRVFNLAGEESLDYTQMLSAFEHFSKETFETREVTVSQVFEENLPLPFPLTEDWLIDGKRFSDTFDFTYTPFDEGMNNTFKIFLSLYTTNS